MRVVTLCCTMLTDFAMQTYGYGETSRTVVKISIVIVDEAFSPELFENDETAEKNRLRKEKGCVRQRGVH